MRGSQINVVKLHAALLCRVSKFSVNRLRFAIDRPACLSALYQIPVCDRISVPTARVPGNHGGSLVDSQRPCQIGWSQIGNILVSGVKMLRKRPAAGMKNDVWRRLVDEGVLNGRHAI